MTLRGSDVIDSKTGFRCANVKVSTWLFPVLIRTSAILLLFHKTGNIFGTDPTNVKMFQRAEPTRSQASPTPAQNVMRYENPQNINSNNMIFTLCLFEYAQLMMLSSLMKVSRCLPGCWKSLWVKASFWLWWCSGQILFEKGR